MKAVILAGGLGSRMRDLTKDIPKPMLTVAGKNLLERKIEILPPEIDEVILVVGYLKEQIMEYFGNEFAGKKVTYVEQSVLNGTGGALWLCKDLLHEKFIVMNGDDLYDAACLRECIKYDWAAAVKEREDASPLGRVEVSPEGKLLGIVEGDTSPTGLIATGVYVLQPEIFNYPLVKIPGREEYGLPQTVVQVVNDFDVKIVVATVWQQMSSPEDLEKAEQSIAA